MSASANLTSAGLLMYRIHGGRLQFFLAHPGGPIFQNKDEGHWGIPKGIAHEGEDLFLTACREFAEETGLPVPPASAAIPLQTVRLRSGKTVHAWAFEGDWEEAAGITSNFFEMEWPPHSGRRGSYPEIDRAGFFDGAAARIKINPAQIPFLDRLEAKLER